MNAGLVRLVVILLVCTSIAAQAQIKSHKNIDYLDGVSYDDEKDLLDIYVPTGADGVPVIVFFHGGGLMFGEKEAGEIFAKALAPQGFAVVSPNYRVSPGVSYPAHVQDAAAAVAWVIENIESYGGNPEEIYVSGHSAGAYLAALLAVNPSFLEEHDLPLTAVRGAFPISPFLYVEETAEDRDKSIWGEDPKSWLEASVSPHITSGKDNILLIYADGDDEWRKEQNERFASSLISMKNHNVSAQQVLNRNHNSLIENILNDDDEIVSLIRNFIAVE